MSQRTPDQIKKIRHMLHEEYNRDGFGSMVGTAVGAASVCWDSMSGAGEFHSEEAAEIVERILGFHQAEIEKAVTAAINRIQLPHAVDAHSVSSGLFDPTKVSPKEKEEGD